MIMSFCCINGFAQYHITIDKDDIIEVINQSLSIKEITQDSVIIRLNNVAAAVSLKTIFNSHKSKKRVKVLREKEIYQNKIRDFIDFFLIDIDPNIAYIKYMQRYKGIIAHLVFKKNISGKWILIDRNVWSSFHIRYDDFLYDSIKEELILDGEW